MNSNLFWLIISFIYIGSLVLIGFILYRFVKLKPESVRKFIHIFTSFWVFILVYKINNPIYMMLGPFLFIFINAFFVMLGLGKYLGMGNRKRDNGLIYYPLSLLILILLMISGYLSKEAVIAGVLTMGLGDGMAALIGVKWGRHKYLIYNKYEKSAEGTLVMFIVTFFIVLFFGKVKWYFSILIALCSTLVENITVLGFDNLTVPLVTAILVEVL